MFEIHQWRTYQTIGLHLQPHLKLNKNSLFYKKEEIWINFARDFPNNEILTS